MEHDLLNIVEVLLRLERVIHAVVALLIKLGVGHIGVIAEMGTSGGFDKSVRHESTGRDDRVDNAAVNQLGNNQALLRYSHRPGQGHDYETILIARHGFEHIGSFAKLAASEGSLRHRAHQIVN